MAEEPEFSERELELMEELRQMHEEHKRSPELQRQAEEILARLPKISRRPGSTEVITFRRPPRPAQAETEAEDVQEE
jgi:hypothetical protein